MVQFNLLPNVKLEYVKAQRTKRLLTAVSLLVSAAALVVLLLMLTLVDVVQKKSLHDLNNDVSKYSTQLKNVPDLDKILTVQNQLGTLTSLHDQKPVASRLFSYISKVTPTEADLNKLTVDFTANTMIIGGTAPSLDTVSTYTDTLKATHYTTDSQPTPKNAFSSVVLSSFGRDDKNATFTITLNFDPAIFNTTNKVQLTVPSTAKAQASGVFGAGS